MEPEDIDRPAMLYQRETYDILGACFEVYNVMGNGFVEPVYQECLKVEFKLKGLQFVPQVELSLIYKGHLLEQKYKPDFVVFDKIIVELKAVKQLADEHRAQILNYLKATNYRVGLLVNFGHSPRVEHERFIR